VVFFVRALKNIPNNFTFDRVMQTNKKAEKKKAEKV
jgi:hypothetical protein